MDDRKIWANGVLAKIVQLGVWQGAARKAELDDRHVCRAISKHERRRDIRRHVFQNDEGAAGQLRNRPRDVRALMQIDFLDADPIVACGLYAAYVVNKGGELPLV